MGVADLLARLEREAGTPGTRQHCGEVPAKALEMQGCTLGTPGTPESDGGQDETARDWPLHFPDAHVEFLESCPDTVWAEPGQASGAVKSCRDCLHHKRPGLADPGYCAGRTDTPHAYGPNHPLRLLPDDGGAGCACWQCKN